MLFKGNKKSTPPYYAGWNGACSQVQPMEKAIIAMNYVGLYLNTDFPTLIKQKNANIKLHASTNTLSYIHMFNSDDH